MVYSSSSYQSPGEAAAAEWHARLRELEAKGIRSRREFRQWARRNHPDRGGDLGEFQRVSQSVDMCFDERTGRPPASWRRPRARRSPEQERRIVEMGGALLGRLLWLVRFRSAGVGYRVWRGGGRRRHANASRGGGNGGDGGDEDGDDEYERDNEDDASSSSSAATDADAQSKKSASRTRRAGVDGNGPAAVLRDVGLAALGNPWRPLRDMELSWDTRRGRAWVRSTLQTPIFGLQVGFGAMLKPAALLVPDPSGKSACSLMATLSKRLGPFHVEFAMSRKERYFERSLKSIDATWGTRIDVVNVNAETVSLLPGILPAVRWRRAKKGTQQQQEEELDEEKVKIATGEASEAGSEAVIGGSESSSDMASDAISMADAASSFASTEDVVADAVSVGLDGATSTSKSAHDDDAPLDAYDAFSSSTTPTTVGDGILNQASARDARVGVEDEDDVAVVDGKG